MSDKNTKSPLEEAKISFEQIKKFATEQAAVQLEEQVAEKLKNLFEETLKEDITITISGDNVDVSKDGESIGMALGSEMGGEMSDDDMDAEKMELDVDGTTMGEPTEDSDDEFMVSDEEDEIGLDDSMEDTIQNKNMEEMNKMTMEQEIAAAAPAAPIDAAPIDGAVAPGADAGLAPTEEAPVMPELLSKLDTLINIMLQQSGGAAPAAAPGAEAGSEEEFQVIDDEAGTPPAGAPAPAAPAMEEEIEITDFELDHDNRNFIDEMEEEMLEIVDEDDAPMTGDAVEETRSLGFTSKRTGDKALKMGTMEKEKGHHAPVTSLKESNKNKAQQESKVDELIKENNSLKNTISKLQGKEKEFEDAFVDLRTQFNEMQLFNGKLALVNKVLMNGGLTTDEKIKICEQFDSVQTYEEASKLFKSIIKENSISVIGDGKEKLRGASTNTAKPKSTSEPLYESVEAKRAKVLAGMTKAEDEE